MGVIDVQGDLFETSAEVVIVPVNCVGVAGRGVALQCRQHFPQWFRQYRRDCLEGCLSIGTVMFYPVSGVRQTVLAFPTKNDWRLPSRLEYIELGLQAVLCGCAFFGFSSLATPKLGVGAGGLSWDDVRPLMHRYLSQFVGDVFIYV